MNVIYTNMYLSLSTEAYNKIPVRQVTAEDGTVANFTLADIFPDARKYPTSNRVLVGVEFSGAEVPALIATAEAMGFTVQWGNLVDASIQIVGISVAKEIDAVLTQVEIDEAIRLSELEAGAAV